MLSCDGLLSYLYNPGIYKFNNILKLLLLLILTAFTWHTNLDDQKPVKLPVTFKNNLISIALPIAGKDTMFFYTDTGGINALYKSGIRKLGVKGLGKDLWEKSGLGTYFVTHELPLPVNTYFNYLKESKSQCDGMLGRDWFAGRTWSFDYKKETVGLGVFFETKEGNLRITVPLHFKSDSLGKALYHLPRFEVIVDADTLSMLFDTGAQAVLTQKAQSRLGKTELVATSFINASTFEKWKQKHPEWEVITKADASFLKKEDMIIVPSVSIGNKIIGPVEFVKRDDSNLELMSDIFMDNPIVGALGGNAFTQIGRFTLDYQNKTLILPVFPHK
ncbi:MAG: hypothetical protein ACI9G9_001084 [Psychromonas sp.]